MKMDSNRVSSATAVTAKAVNKAIDNIDSENNINQATQLRIHKLEKQLLCQQQPYNTIINQLKKKKQKNL
jgi:hypothetical protein